MSRIRHVELYDANGDPIILDSDRVPVKADLYDAAGNPLNATGTSLDVNLTNEPSVNLQDGAGTDISSTGGSLDVNLTNEPSVNLQDGSGTDILLEANGGLPVNLQDQTSPAVIIPANQVIVTTTLNGAVTLDTNTCTVDDSTGMTVGDMIVFTSTTGDRYMWAYITVIAVNDLTISTYFDYAFEDGQEVSACTNDLAVDGSSTRQIFSLRAAEPAGGVGIEVDVTQVIFEFETATAPTLTDFGDIAGGLTNGLLMRRVDGTYQNIFAIRRNDELQSVSGPSDFALYSTLGFAVNGLAAKISFSGQNNVGVTLRIGPLEDLQFIVSDDLSSLDELRVMIIGHIVTS